MPYFNKALSETTTTQPRLHKTFLHNRSEENKKLFAKQRNCCASLPRKTKLSYYGNLDKKCVFNNKLFSKTIEAFLSDKVVGKGRIHLTESKILKLM